MLDIKKLLGKEYDMVNDIDIDNELNVDLDK